MALSESARCEGMFPGATFTSKAPTIQNELYLVAHAEKGDRSLWQALQCGQGLSSESVPEGSRDWRQMGPVTGMTLFPMNRLQTPVRLKEHRVVCSRRSSNFSDSPNFSCLLSAPKLKGPTGWDSTWGRSSRDRPQLCSMLSPRLPA